MADKRISQLDSLTARSSRVDFLPVLDTSASETKKVQVKNLPLTDLQKLNLYPYTTDFQSSTKQTRNLTSIATGDGYKNNTNLTSISIGSNVTGIDTRSFFQATNLVTRVFSEGLIDIGEEAFYNCNKAIVNASGGILQLPSTVTSIGVNAFGYNQAISGFIGHEGLVSIGNDAFLYCSTLTKVVIPDSPISLGLRVFKGCTVQDLTLGTGTTRISNAAFSYGSADKIKVSSNFTTIGSTAFTHGTASFYKANSITTIEGSAFRYGSLNSISGDGTKHTGRLDISDNLSIISGSAFEYSSLKTAVLPSSLTSIGGRAFYGCNNLTGIDCFVPKSIFASDSLAGTSANLVIHARASDLTWSGGLNQSVAGNPSVDVIKDL